MKRSGVLSRETISGIQRLSRKFGWYPKHEDVWHLLDTIDAQRLVIERLLEDWVPGRVVTSDGDGRGWWFDARDGSTVRSSEEMSQVEQLIIYDRVVRSDAPSWPSDDDS